MHYEPCLHIVLFQPEIPYNAGSVGRTCVAVGAKLWMVRPLGFRTDDYYLRRAGLDYWRFLEWEVVDDWRTLTERLGRRPFFFFSKSADRCFSTMKFTKDSVLVFGGESQGLPRTMVEKAGDAALRIPIRPQVRSLNLSNAVAIVAYEALRQWEFEGL